MFANNWLIRLRSINIKGICIYRPRPFASNTCLHTMQDIVFDCMAAGRNCVTVLTVLLLCVVVTEGNSILIYRMCILCRSECMDALPPPIHGHYSGKTRTLKKAIFLGVSNRECILTRILFFFFIFFFRVDIFKRLLLCVVDVLVCL